MTIDLDAVVDNYRILQNRLSGVECAAVVKADAYGLGAGPVASALAHAGCRRFFVSSVDEGIALRQDLDASFPGVAVHVLTGPPKGGETALEEYGLTPILYSRDQIERWSSFARDRGDRPAAILEVETGMNRLGLPHPEVEKLAADPSLLEPIDIAFVMSHLACADSPGHPMNRSQRDSFETLRGSLPDAKATLANSAGIFLGPDFHYDLARPGAALYGIAPHPEEANPMKPVVGLRGKILQLRDVDTNMTVGYGAAHRVTKPTRLATVAVGYADGLLRSLSDRGTAYVGDTKVPVVGRVSMDLVVFDVSDVPVDALAGDAYVDLIGPHHTVDALALEAGTIGYEILTSLGRRYRRSYLGGI